MVCPFQKIDKKASKATAVQYFIAGKAKSLQNYLFTMLRAKKRAKWLEQATADLGTVYIVRVQDFGLFGPPLPPCVHRVCIWMTPLCTRTTHADPPCLG